MPWLFALTVTSVNSDSGEVGLVVRGGQGQDGFLPAIEPGKLLGDDDDRCGTRGLYFRASPEIRAHALSIGLTAISTGYTVSVRTDDLHQGADPAVDPIMASVQVLR
jgi:hypothetical protein